MRYKDYEAVIEYDESDRLFFGRVINTEDITALCVFKTYNNNSGQNNFGDEQTRLNI